MKMFVTVGDTCGKGAVNNGIFFLTGHPAPASSLPANDGLLMKFLKKPGVETSVCIRDRRSPSERLSTVRFNHMTSGKG